MCELAGYCASFIRTDFSTTIRKGQLYNLDKYVLALQLQCTPHTKSGVGFSLLRGGRILNSVQVTFESKDPRNYFIKSKQPSLCKQNAGCWDSMGFAFKIHPSQYIIHPVLFSIPCFLLVSWAQKIFSSIMFWSVRSNNWLNHFFCFLFHIKLLILFSSFYLCLSCLL